MKRSFCALLCCLIITTLLPLQASANGDFGLGQHQDISILAGGIYDLYAFPDGNYDDFTFQWQVDVSMGNGSWSDLTDNANPYGYLGTQTYNLQLVTAFGEGMVVGTGWENIPFRCVVTHKKTGVTKVTADLFMYIYSSNDLSAYLKRQGFGLYEPSVVGAGKLTTSDYIQYTGTAAAGTQLSLYTGCWRPNGEHTLRASNFTENIEIWITENGQTYKKENETTYTPYTIGKNAVTIQYKLHHALGIHDLGYYETKTVQLTITEPEMIGYATAKNQISLLKEQYNESQKLASIPKGAEFKITGKSGGYYQAVWNGYVGYVASSSVTFREFNPIIDHVDITIAEPGAGNLPPTSCTTEPSSCFVTSVEWLDKTTGHFMEPGERFIKGHDYQLVIWASAKEGYWFKLDSNDNMLTTAIINGNLPAYTSRAYEQVIGKVIDIRYDFRNVQEAQMEHTCKPTHVSKVSPTCTEPGREAYYRCSCGKAYADAAGKNQINTSTWGILPATGHSLTEWRYNQAEHYKYCQNCHAMLELASHTGGTATCTQKPVCTVCNFAYGMTDPEHRWGPKFDYTDASGHAWICADCKTHDTVRPHTPGAAATETTPQICTTCNYIIVPAQNHTHKLSKVEAVSATCVTAGTAEYYACDGCSELFTDATGKTVITDRAALIVGALGHDLQNGKCTRCGHEENSPTETTASETAPPTETGAPDSNKETAEPNDPMGWLAPILIAIVSFSAAITVMVIILKMKKK